PVLGLHVPATWHWSAAAHTTGLLPTQAPLWQASVWVHALPSLQAVALAAAGEERAPGLGLQVPATLDWSAAVHTTGLLPTQVPLWQASVRVHALPSLQAVPLAAVGLEHAPVLGLQVPATWHWSAAAHTIGLLPTQVPLWQASVRVHAL